MENGIRRSPVSLSRLLLFFSSSIRLQFPLAIFIPRAFPLRNFLSLPTQVT